MDPHFDGVIFQTHAAELARRILSVYPPFAVVDVRPPERYRHSHLPGALSFDGAALAEGPPAAVDLRAEVFVVGEGPGDPAVRAASLALRRHGARRVVELGGGMLEWVRGGHPTEGEGRRAA